MITWIVFDKCIIVGPIMCFLFTDHGKWRLILLYMEGFMPNKWCTTVINLIRSYLIMIYVETNVCKVLALLDEYYISIFTKSQRKIISYEWSGRIS